MNASDPNTGVPPPGGVGFHSVLVKSRYSPAWTKTGYDCQTRTATNPATAAMMRNPAARVAAWKSSSGSADGCGGGGAGSGDMGVILPAGRRHGPYLPGASRSYPLPGGERGGRHGSGYGTFSVRRLTSRFRRCPAWPPPVFAARPGAGRSSASWPYPGPPARSPTSGTRPAPSPSRPAASGRAPRSSSRRSGTTPRRPRAVRVGRLVGGLVGRVGVGRLRRTEGRGSGRGDAVQAGGGHLPGIVL